MANMPSQKQMELSARRQVLRAYIVFNEIQQGPNPLTPEDVRKLIERWPDFWGKFEAWATEPLTKFYPGNFKTVRFFKVD